MRSLIYPVLTLAFAISLTAAPAFSAEEKSKIATIPLEITGMICVKCESPLKRAIKKLDGVSRVIVDRLNGKAYVSYDASKVTPQQMVKAVNKTGFTATVEKR